MSRYMQNLACRFHPDAILIEDSRAGDMICPQCGLVVGERMIDVSSEWRSFGNDGETKDRSRVGGPQNYLYGNDDLETTTFPGSGVKNSAALDNPKSFKKTSQISTEDKALRTAHDAIRTLATRIGLTKRIVDRALLVFKHCYKTKCVRGRPQDVIIASCIYTACRREGSPRTIKEISNFSTISTKEIGRVFLKIKRSIPTLDVPDSIEIKDLVPRFCNQLELKQANLVRKAAIYIAEQATKVCDLQSRAPSSIAAASIYMACSAASEKKSKKDIQVPTGVSEGVIRDIYRIMRPHAAKLFPADFLSQYSATSLPLA